jgi:hypothetical protein
VFVSTAGTKRHLGTGFHAFQSEQIKDKRITALLPDSNSVKAHPDADGVSKKREISLGEGRGGSNTKIHMMVVDNRLGVIISVMTGKFNGSLNKSIETIKVKTLSFNDWINN